MPTMSKTTCLDGIFLFFFFSVFLVIAGEMLVGLVLDLYSEVVSLICIDLRAVSSSSAVHFSQYLSFART